MIRNTLLWIVLALLLPIGTASAQTTSKTDPWQFKVIQGKCAIQANFEDSTIAVFYFDRTPDGTGVLWLETRKPGFIAQKGGEYGSMRVDTIGNFKADKVDTISKGTNQTHTLAWINYGKVLMYIGAGSMFSVSIDGKSMGWQPLPHSSKVVQQLEECAGI